MIIHHPIEPVYSSSSRILILGSFPSVKSREGRFFYHHKGNRFWHVMEDLFSVSLPDIETRRAFLLEKNIALWDSIASCEIEGSDDSRIRNARPNDLDRILSVADIRMIFTNGKKSDEMYAKHFERERICLPSTSARNVSWPYDRLLARWSVIKEYLKEE